MQTLQRITVYSFNIFFYVTQTNHDCEKESGLITGIHFHAGGGHLIATVLILGEFMNLG